MSENSNIIDVNETEFNDQVIEASENKLIVVDFWAPWCGPCKQLTPILEKIISKLGDKITLVKINIDENQQIAAQLRIQSIPTVYAFKEKQIVNAFQGVLPEKQVQEFIEKCLGSKLSEDYTEFLWEMQAMCGFYSTPDGADYGEANLEEMNELVKSIKEPISWD